MIRLIVILAVLAMLIVPMSGCHLCVHPQPSCCFGHFDYCHPHSHCYPHHHHCEPIVICPHPEAAEGH